MNHHIRTRLPGLILFTVLLAVDPAPVPAQPGELDGTFGDGGVTAPLYRHPDRTIPERETFLIRMQGEKIIAVGQDHRFANTFVFPLRRFLKDGSLDTTFGTGGETVLDNSYLDRVGTVRAMTVPDDGSILTAGIVPVPYTAFPERQDIAILKYRPDGKPDETFGLNGMVTTDIGNISNEVYDIALQNDGKILLLWRSYKEENNYDIGLLRYRPNGMLDSTFGADGLVLTDVGGSNDVGYDFLLQKDGKILVAGSTETEFGYTDPLILRYTTNGRLDPAFGSGGIVRPSMIRDQSLNAIALQPDGKILAAGRMFNGFDDDILLFRCNSNGSPDRTFGSEGIVTTDFGNTNITYNWKRGPATNAYDAANALALQKDGRIVVAGYTMSVDNTDLALLRYNADGSPDESFGDGGKVIEGPKVRRHNERDHEHRAYDVLIQPDGNIVIAGTRDRLGSLFLARYRADGSATGSPSIASTDKGKAREDVTEARKETAESVPEQIPAAVAGEVYRGFVADVRITFPEAPGNRLVVEYRLLRDDLLTIDLYDPDGIFVTTLLPSQERMRGEGREEFELEEAIRSGGYLLELKGGEETVIGRVPDRGK